MVQTTCGAERTVLAQVAEGDIGKLPFRVPKESAHDRVLVETNQDNLGESGHAGERRQGMPYHRLWSYISTAREIQEARARHWTHLACHWQQGLGAWRD